MDHEFPDFENLPQIPGLYSKRRRGRPVLIEDVALSSRCEHLLGFFQFYWADVAWDLERAKSLAALRAALSRAEGRVRDELHLFRMEDIHKGTQKQLIERRKELRRLEARYRIALDDETEAKQRAIQGRQAAADHPDDERIKNLAVRRESAWNYAQRLVQSFRQQVDELRDEIGRREAYFAQTELLDFLQSGRFRITPESLSRAMAGPPFITWRQSVERLRKVKINPPHPLEYEKFKIVLKALGKQIPRNSQTATARVRRFLQHSPKRTLAVSELKKTWFYLREEIEKAFDAQPRAAIPYRAYAQYYRRVGSPTSADELLAEEEAID